MYNFYLKSKINVGKCQFNVKVQVSVLHRTSPIVVLFIILLTEVCLTKVFFNNSYRHITTMGIMILVRIRISLYLSLG